MSTGECRFCSADRYRDSSYGFRSTQQLAEAGYAVSELERAVLLVPSAFARELFEPEGITFTEVFHVRVDVRTDHEFAADGEVFRERARPLACRPRNAQSWASEDL